MSVIITIIFRMIDETSKRKQKRKGERDSCLNKSLPFLNHEQYLASFSKPTFKY